MCRLATVSGLTDLRDKLGAKDRLFGERPSELVLYISGGGDGQLFGNEPFGFGNEVACTHESQ